VPSAQVSKHTTKQNMRHPGIEPGALRWQRSILPLNQWRLCSNTRWQKRTEPRASLRIWQNKQVRRPGFEPGSPAWKAGILTTGLTTRPLGNQWQSGSAKKFPGRELNHRGASPMDRFPVTEPPRRRVQGGPQHHDGACGVRGGSVTGKLSNRGGR
jgi:hypothetical protein